MTLIPLKTVRRDDRPLWLRKIVLEDRTLEVSLRFSRTDVTQFACHTDHEHCGSRTSLLVNTKIRRCLTPTFTLQETGIDQDLVVMECAFGNCTTLPVALSSS